MARARDADVGWERLVTLTAERRIAHALFVVAPAFLFTAAVVYVGSELLPDASFWARALLGLGASAVAALLAVACAIVFRRGVFVDLAAARLRVGNHVLAFCDIDKARVVRQGDDSDVMLVFGSAHRTQAKVLISVDPDTELDRSSRNRLVAVLEASSIQMPVSQYDPTGRFAQHNFPDNLSREQAIGLVRDPAAAHERLLRSRCSGDENHDPGS